MASKIEKRLKAAEDEVARLKELLSTQKYHKGSTLHDLHTMIQNTDFLLYNVKELGDKQLSMQQQHQQQMQNIMTDFNLMQSFIKSKGLHNEYPLYRKDMLEKQEEKRKEAESARSTDGDDGATSTDTAPGREDKS